MDKTYALTPMPLQHTEMIRAARAQALRASSATDLMTLDARLETACETARVAALRNMREHDLQAGNDGGQVHTFGFARLFGALRRVRAEIKYREAEHSINQRPLSVKRSR